jgi:phage-related protein
LVIIILGEQVMDDIGKPLAWIGSSKEDLLDLPRKVQREVGYALYLAQTGLEHTNVKPLTGFGGRGVLEVVEDDAGGTYRAVYTVKYKEAIYILHAFQKKSKKGRETPKEEMEIVKKRLKIAEQKHEEWLKKVSDEKKNKNI